MVFKTIWNKCQVIHTTVLAFFLFSTKHTFTHISEVLQSNQQGSVINADGSDSCTRQDLAFHDLKNQGKKHMYPALFVCLIYIVQEFLFSTNFP